MKAKGRTLRVVILAGLLVAGRQALAQEAASAAETPKASAAQLLEVVPADAWLVVGLHDVETLDIKFMQIVRAFSIPAGFLPSGGVRYLVGGGDPIDMTGTHGLIFLSHRRFPHARNWWWLDMVELPAVVALMSTDPAALLQSMQPEAAEDGISSLMLGQEESYGAIRGKYLLISADRQVLAALLEGIADPKTTKAANPVLVVGAAGADVLLDVNIRAMLADYRDDWHLSATACLESMVAEEPARAPKDAIDAVYRAAMTSIYVNLLLEQVGDLVIAGNVNEQRVQLTGRLTYPAGSVLGKGSPPAGDESLIVGLPTGRYFAAAGMREPAIAELQRLSHLLAPLAGFWRFADSFDLREMGETLGSSIFDDERFYGTLRYNTAGLYTRPGSAEGILTIVDLMGCPDADKAWDLVKAKVLRAFREGGAVAGNGSPIDESFFQFKPAAEKVGEVAVDLWGLELARTQEGEDEDHVKTESAMFKLFFGADGPTARVARTKQALVAAIGGSSAELMRKAVPAATAGQAPLAADPLVAQAAAALPKDRIFETHIEPAALTDFFTAMTREMVKITQQDGPVPSEWTSREAVVPFGIGLSSRPDAAQFEIHLPMDSMVVMKDFFVWTYEYQMAQMNYYMQKYQESQQADEEGELDEDQAEETEGTDEPTEEPGEATPSPM